MNVKKKTIIVAKDPAKANNQYIAKVAEETETFHPKTFGREAGKQILKCRAERKWTQKDLAVKLNVKCNIISSYEDGSAIYDSNMVQKINRLFNIKLNCSK